MGKHRTPYPAEFRAQMVELVKAGRTPEELEKEFEPTAQTIYNWLGATRSRLWKLFPRKRRELAVSPAESRSLNQERL
jgi:transposase